MAALGLASPRPVPVLALSGGGDSVALMHLLGAWLRNRTAPPPHALIVDHGLRPESAAEAKRAAAWARRAGFRAHVLGGKTKRRSNIEDEARTLRYRLMGEWCRDHGAARLFVAHTRDDVAETFLLRLGRGSGVDGLAAMRARAPYPLPGFAGLELARPLLAFSRAELRGHLRRLGAEWIEDPMNDDARFSRARMRALLPLLEEAGVPAARIAAAAHHLARAREALESETRALLAAHARFESASRIFLDADALAAAPREIGLRALGAVLMAVSGAYYRPRFEALEAVYEAAVAGLARARTLHGCRIGPAPKRMRPFGERTLEIAREPGRKRAQGAKSPHKGRNFAGKLRKSRI